MRQIGKLIEEGNHDDSTTEAMLEEHLQSLERENESLRHQQRVVIEQIASRTNHRGRRIGGQELSRKA